MGVRIERDREWRIRSTRDVMPLDVANPALVSVADGTENRITKHERVAAIVTAAGAPCIDLTSPRPAT